MRNLTFTITGTDKGERYFENKLKLSPSQGLLGIYRVRDVLNAEYAATGTWVLYSPTGETNYQAKIILNVRDRDRPVVQNVQTKYLSFYSGVALKHYNLAYGFDTVKGTVAVAEQWDPQWTYGALPAKYKNMNPYGKHKTEPRANAFNAVKYSTNGQFVV